VRQHQVREHQLHDQRGHADELDQSGQGVSEQGRQPAPGDRDDQPQHYGDERSQHGGQQGDLEAFQQQWEGPRRVFPAPRAHVTSLPTLLPGERSSVLTDSIRLGPRPIRCLARISRAFMATTQTQAITKYASRPKRKANKVPVTARIWSIWKYRSVRAIRLTIAVPFSSWISRLDREGIISAQACGTMMRNIPRTGLRLSALIASYCPWGTELIDPRTTSAP